MENVNSKFEETSIIIVSPLLVWVIISISYAGAQSNEVGVKSDDLSLPISLKNYSEPENMTKGESSPFPDSSPGNQSVAGDKSLDLNNNSKSLVTSESDIDKDLPAEPKIPQDYGVFDEDLPLAPDTPVARPEKYEVKVQIDSMTVHDDHDPWPKGKGEIVNYAFIQGHRVILNTHINSGYTKFFEPPKEVTVTLGSNVPLSIFTAGIETDFCTTGAKLETHPPEYLNQLNPVFGNPSLDWSQAISNVQSEIIKNYLAIGECNWDKLGSIKQFHEPTQYQAGPHSVKSSSGDFTLRYTILVTTIES
jgi:hypothetical protein